MKSFCSTYSFCITINNRYTIFISNDYIDYSPYRVYAYGISNRLYSFHLTDKIKFYVL